MRHPFFAGIVLGVLFGITTALTPHQAAGESLKDKAKAMKKTLEKDGFNVAEGEYVPLDFTKLYCQGLAESCNANNFGAPYLAGVVPKLEGQAPTNLEPFSFRLRRDEAVVLLGPTPPPCKYYSYVALLMYRWDEDMGRPRKILSALGDPLNLWVLKTGRGDAFGKDVVLIYTGDEGINKTVKKAAKSAGFSGRVINTFVIPSPQLRTNEALDQTTDQMVIGQRTALFDKPDDGLKYQTDPGIILYRVTPAKPVPDKKLKPMAVPEQRVRGTGETELERLPMVEQLREAILAAHPGLSAQEYTTVQFIEQSPIAIQTWTNTLGDSSDATYLRTKETFKLSEDPNDFLIAYGVNHEKAKKATYSNINVYQACKMCGVASVDSSFFPGTAEKYLPESPSSETKFLYAYKIARNCGVDPNCLTVPTGPCGEGVQPDDDLLVGFRAYVEPKTKAGPAYTELIFDRVIHFTSPPPSIEGLPDQPFQSTFPDPVLIDFHVAAAGGGVVRWRAELMSVDEACCGTLEPDRGTVPGATGDVALLFMAVRPGSFTVTLSVEDLAGRGTSREVSVEVLAP